MAYTPPTGDNANFTFEGDYTPPAGNNVDFLFGVVANITINSVSRDIIYDDQTLGGFSRSVINWTSDVPGDYRIELGGSGVYTGDLIEAGSTYAGFQVKSEIIDSDLEAATTFSGVGAYRFNIYVESEDDVWTPYAQA